MDDAFLTRLTFQGALARMTTVHNRWKQQHFCLVGRHLQYRDHIKDLQDEPSATFELSNAAIETHPASVDEDGRPRDFCFIVQSADQSERPWILCATGERERKEWLRALRQQVEDLRAFRRGKTAEVAAKMARTTADYTVTKDDTFAGIALRNKMTPAELKQINKMFTTSVVPGQKIKIFSAEPTMQCASEDIDLFEAIRGASVGSRSDAVADLLADPSAGSHTPTLTTALAASNAEFDPRGGRSSLPTDADDFDPRGGSTTSIHHRPNLTHVLLPAGGGGGGGGGRLPTDGDADDFDPRGGSTTTGWDGAADADFDPRGVDITGARASTTAAFSALNNAYAPPSTLLSTLPKPQPTSFLNDCADGPKQLSTPHSEAAPPNQQEDPFAMLLR